MPELRSTRKRPGIACLRPAWLCGAALLLWCGCARGGTIEMVRWKLADGFDHAVGRPDARGYHKERGFWPGSHLGEDWNGDGGGDTDLGDPIYAIGHGVCVLSEDVRAGWGNVIIIRHAFRDATGKIDMVDSLYGHLLDRKLKVGEKVERGQLVGRMGSNNGMYSAHLHLEVRKNLAIGMNRTRFAPDYSNYYSPTAFIESHRRLPAEFRRYEIPVNTFARHGEDLNQEQRAFLANRASSPGAAAAAPAKAGSGLSIPITVTRSGKTAPLPKVTDTPKPAAPDTAQPPVEEKKGDFWSRLKAKLKSGESTDPSRHLPR